jgi:hypothetical protein
VAYPNIEKIQQLKPSGTIHLSGPLDDEYDPEPGLLETHVFATVAQPGQKPDGVMGTATNSWNAGTWVWDLHVDPAHGTFSDDVWAWVNALAVRIYDNGNVDTVSWSRWVQVLAGPAPS